MTPREKAIIAATIYDNPYISQKPIEKQRTFLADVDSIEGFYGGSAGPGKSSGLLMAALQYVTEKNYAALLLRRTYKDLALPGALMDRAHEWLQGKAHWDDQEKTWAFKSGATLTFGYLETEVDKYRYQGAEFNFVGFDELTQFTESQYTYLFSRLRRLEGSDIPIRMRAASNPGGVGHDWVKQRFIVPGKDELAAQGRYFIRALMEDNPYLDRAAYELALSKLDPVTREQLRNGNWDITLSGGLFQRQWFEIVPGAPRGRQVRYWDLAATEKKKGKNPDWTAGCLMSEKNGIYYIKDIIRFQKSPADEEDIIKQTARLDGIETEIFMEQEPGASGVIVIDHYARVALKGYSFHGIKSTGEKVIRAKPLSAAAANRNVKLVQGLWNKDFLEECEPFPNEGIHDDQVDAASGAFTQLTQHVTTSYLPQFGHGFGSTQAGLRI